MKYLALLTLLSLFVSCKKEDTYKYQFGHFDNVEITVQNKTVKATYEDYSEEYMGIDVDNDSTEDFRFYSEFDSINYPYGNTFWETEIRILDSTFSIYEIPESGAWYETLGPKVFDYYGTYPRQTRALTYGCSAMTGSYKHNSANNPYFFSVNSPVMFDTYSWGNYIPLLTLSNSGYYSEQYDFNITGDSLLGVAITSEPSCYGVPADEIIYLAYRKSVTDGYYLGWIEMKITEDNRITVFRTAIGTDLESF